MINRDQQLLEEAYQSIYDSYFLLEKVYGNIAVVYHRKKGDPQDSALFSKGIGGANREGAETSAQTQGEIKRAVYGTGLYACYDFNSQLKREMAETYGEYIVKGKLDLTNFFFLDEEAFKVARPRENFLDHLNSLRITGKLGEPGFEFYEFSRFKERVREHKTTKTDKISQIDASLEIWPALKQQGFAGLMYLNKDDGKVAVIYNRSSFLPFQYGFVPAKEIKRLLALPPDQREKAVEWTNKSPDVKNIKRGNDEVYDADFQKQSARDILRLNTTKQATVPFLYLDLLKDLTSANFPYVKQCTGEIRLVEYRRDPSPAHLSLPSLEQVGSINIEMLRERSTLDLGSLKRVGRNMNITIPTSLHFDMLKTCGGRIWIRNPQSIYELKEIVSLKSLTTCEGAEIVIDRAIKIDLSSLTSFKGTIHAPECMEIILPANFKIAKSKLKLAKGGERKPTLI